MEPDPYASSLHDLREALPLLVWGAAGLAAVFLVLMLVRLWGWRTQKRGGACGGIDLDALRRQWMAGEIGQDEYEAVRRSIAGADAEPEPSPAPAASPAPARDAETGAETSIKPDGEAPDDGNGPNEGDAPNQADNPGDDPERSKANGEA